MPLLNGDFEPLTFCVGFIEQPFGIVADEYIRWTKRNQKAVEIFPLECGLAEGLARLEPLTAPLRRKLLISTDSAWIAYFDNFRLGTDARTPVAYLTRTLCCRGVVATCVPNTLNSDTGRAAGMYGAVTFELFASAKREFLNYERSVCAANNGGRWVFSAEGAVQPYEEVERYGARKIRDRFTPDMLERYCAALGLRLFDADFYGGPAVLVIVKDVWPTEAVLTLREARREMRLE